MCWATLCRAACPNIPIDRMCVAWSVRGHYHARPPPDLAPAALLEASQQHSTFSVLE